MNLYTATAKDFKEFHLIVTDEDDRDEVIVDENFSVIDFYRDCPFTDEDDKAYGIDVFTFYLNGNKGTKLTIGYSIDEIDESGSPAPINSIYESTNKSLEFNDEAYQQILKFLL